jgi:membrane-bound lytic murein transglycosylase D
MFVSLENGNRITQIISRDASEPAAAAPATAYAGPARGAVLSDDPIEAKSAPLEKETHAAPQPAINSAPVETPQASENKVAEAAILAAAASTPDQPKESPTPAPEPAVAPVAAPVSAPASAPATIATTASIPAEPVVIEHPAVTPPPANLQPSTTAPLANPTPAVTQPAPQKVNIANEVAVEEEEGDDEKGQPVAKAEEPKDEFSRLKARLDKVVYAPRKTTSTSASVQQQPATVTPAPVVASPPVPAAKLPADDKQYHTVKSGDTAFGIAKKYGVTMKELMAMNNLNFEAIKIGQKLRVK